MARDGTRLALFIDGANAHATTKALGFDIDYKRLSQRRKSPLSFDRRARRLG
jgi:uncharacterized LabA/DUF88 family protein